MAKHSKKILGSIQPKLGTLINDEGNSTEVGEETFNEMMNKHYPSHTKAKDTTYNEEKHISLSELSTLYNDWINSSRVSKALCGCTIPRKKCN